MVMVTLEDSPEAEQTSEPGREGWTSPKVRQEASGEHRTPLRPTASCPTSETAAPKEEGTTAAWARMTAGVQNRKQTTGSLLGCCHR